MLCLFYQWLRPENEHRFIGWDKKSHKILRIPRIWLDSFTIKRNMKIEKNELNLRRYSFTIFFFIAWQIHLPVNFYIFPSALVRSCGSRTTTRIASYTRSRTLPTPRCSSYRSLSIRIECNIKIFYYNGDIENLTRLRQVVKNIERRIIIQVCYRKSSLCLDWIHSHFPGNSMESCWSFYFEAQFLK